MQLIYIEK